MQNIYAEYDEFKNVPLLIQDSYGKVIVEVRSYYNGVRNGAVYTTLNPEQIVKLIGGLIKWLEEYNKAYLKEVECMTEQTYEFALDVFGEVRYSSKIQDTNPQHALSWGFYWLPDQWIRQERGGGICAKIRIVHEDGTVSPWKYYGHPTLDDATYINPFTDEDLEHLLAGQDLVWKIIDRTNGNAIGERIFNRRKAAVAYIECAGRHNSFNAYPKHIWVDGWYDERYSWEPKKSDKME